MPFICQSIAICNMDRHRQEQELIICSLIAGCAGQLDPWLDEASRPYQVAILAVIYPVSGAAELDHEPTKSFSSAACGVAPQHCPFSIRSVRITPRRPAHAFTGHRGSSLALLPSSSSSHSCRGQSPGDGRCLHIIGHGSRNSSAG